MFMKQAWIGASTIGRAIDTAVLCKRNEQDSFIPERDVLILLKMWSTPGKTNAVVEPSGLNQGSVDGSTWTRTLV